MGGFQLLPLHQLPHALSPLPRFNAALSLLPTNSRPTPRRCSCFCVSSSLSTEKKKKEDAARLKRELFTAIDAAQGSLDHACLSIVSALEDLHILPECLASSAGPQLHDVLRGCLLLTKANFKDNRPTNKQKPQLLGCRGALTTLGSTTFNMLKPTDLQIALFDIYQHVSIEANDSYNLITEFSVGESSSAEDDSLLRGLIINKARYQWQTPNRFQVEFLSCDMRPRNPRKDLQRWRDLFAEPNPGMRELDGSLVVGLPSSIKGWSDLLFMDDEVRIQRGNKGGVSVMTVLAEPVVSI